MQSSSYFIKIRTKINIPSMSVENSGSEEWEYKEIIIALKQ